MADEIEIAQPISIRETGLDEYWLQNQISDNPSCLGLGELETIAKERSIHWHGFNKHAGVARWNIPFWCPVKYWNGDKECDRCDAGRKDSHYSKAI